MKFLAFSSIRKARTSALLLAASTACWAIPAVGQTPAAVTATAAPAHAKLGAWGIDLTGRDLAVKPGDDFEKYASGKWLERTQIAPDKPEVNSFYDLFDLSQDQLASNRREETLTGNNHSLHSQSGLELGFPTRLVSR